MSGELDLQSVFEAVLDYSAELFGNDQAGLFVVELDRHPLRLAAHRGLSQAVRDAVARISADDGNSVGLRAIRTRRIIAIKADDVARPELREIHQAEGMKMVCFVPIVFRDEPVGLLVLFHSTNHEWPRAERDLATAFADQMAVAIANARLHEGIQNLAARLRSIGELAHRLNRVHDVAGIGEVIVAELRTLIDYDTIRVYRIDYPTGTCEPIAFQGTFRGTDNPAPELLRMPVGSGLTGWVAANAIPVRVGDAVSDPRSVLVGSDEGPESMLVVPMTYEDRVYGVVVLSKVGRDRFSEADETTLSIFGGYAAQAMVNAVTAEQVLHQQTELEHQLASQRRLLEVNEHLLSTLDPHAVLEMIADSLRSVVRYDTLGLMVVDWEAGVRRAVVARDRFADVILAHVSPVFSGITGWVIEHGEPVLANDAHLDPRTSQIPGTPFEPESMLILPLVVDGRVEGTLNIGRIGDEEAHFSANEFDLTRLFAAQASIALQNAKAHRAVEARAELDSLTGLRNHGAFQREVDDAVQASDGQAFSILLMDLDSFKAYNDTHGHPAGDTLLRSIAAAISSMVRTDDRSYRYGGDEFAVLLPMADRSEALDVADRIRAAIASLFSPTDKVRVGVSIGIACFPADGRTKDDLVITADRALYLVKPSARARGAPEGTHDAYLSALNETALALMDRLDPTELLRMMLQRAANLMGTQDGFIYVVEPDESALVVRVGIGIFADYLGYRIGRGEGVSGTVWGTGRPMTVDDYAAFTGRRADLPVDEFGAVVAVPLTSGGRVVGVIGISSGTAARTFGEREIAALERFGQLASIALTNARLFAEAQREVSERGRAEEALRASEERFRRLSDATTEAVLIGRGGVILEVNQALINLFGFSEEELVGRSVLDLTAPDSQAFIRAQLRARPDEPFEALAVHAGGEIFPVEVRSRTIPYSDSLDARVASIHDLRERRAMEERIAHQTLYDSITGLANRVLLMDRVRFALSSSRIGDEVPIALILLDLDRFKVVNESLGHAAGDQLLSAVAERLEGSLRPGDTVARFGGDEFGILLDGVAGPDEARGVAERIGEELGVPFQLIGRDVYIAASMGIVVGRPGYADPDELLRDAEIALYRAKADATVRHAMFEPSMSSETIERLDLENDLRRAVDRGELRVYYQPVVDLATDRIAGLEALVRWQHPVRGLVPPLAFIPLAEETGLILSIGRWVLETACRQARAWQLAFPAEVPLTISVNLSPRQFAQPDLAGQVASILAETGLPSSSLELEITESVVMDDSEAGVRVLSALRALGCRLALDDFGTGYSSLSYIKSLPLDTLKVDRSFVAGLSGDDVNLPIVQAVITLAHALGIDVTAEGIETAEQLNLLRELSCDQGQGFYYARPLPADRVASLLATGEPLVGRPVLSAAEVANDRPARSERVRRAS